MTTKILDISEYSNYKGKTVSLRDPTGSDMIAVNDAIIKERKAKGEENQYRISLMLLSRVIVDAPFDKKLETLEALPAKLLSYLISEVGGMISPLVKKDENLSSPTIEEEK